MDSRKLKRKGPGVPQRKTEYERQQTHEEVEQIKRDLVNFAQTPWGIEWIRSNLKIGRPFRMQRGIEYVKDKRVITNPNNPNELAQKIIYVLSDDNLLEKLSKDSEELSNKLSWDKIAERTLDVYSKIR